MSSPRTLLVCSCEQSMRVDADAIGRACGATARKADQLCRRELDLFRGIVQQGGPVTVACTQESPLFAETAEDMGAAADLTFANIRETAGWSEDGGRALPKMAALIAAAAEPMPPIQLVTLSSKGVALILGRDDVALEAGRRLADRLDITVLLQRTDDIAPPRTTDFPIAKGRVVGATGHLGAFALTVDGFALPAPSSRARLVFGPGKDGAQSTSDIVIDLTGGPALFPAPDLRPGYLRADPGDRAAVERVLFDAANLVGEFDKPRYIQFTETLCAHSRNRKTGCTRCLDLCPTGAIAPAGDHVAIDPTVCAGCGACAAACPTGAASYALPTADAMMRRLRTLLTVYRQAGGRDAVLLIHDGDHGEALIDAAARFGTGLPANVLPLKVNEVTQVGLEVLAAAFAYGAAGVRLLTRGKPKHDMTGTDRVVALANTVLAGLGYGTNGVMVLGTDDPDALVEALAALPLATATAKPATFLPMGEKRGVLDFALKELHRAAPVPADVVALPAGAPHGGLKIDVDGCTLCLSCVAVCPAAALTDNPERPTLRFTESLCVQCGLCAATCPEKVITLAPQIDFAAWDQPKKLIKEEEPFHCIQCSKPFGTKATIEKVTKKLGAAHWMFQGENKRRLQILMMCDSCRVEAVINENINPYGMPERPRPRTSEDYLRERDEGKDDLA
jgi:ferredoxin